MKHIEVAFHHIQELITEKKLEVQKIDTQVNIADCSTKPLPNQRFRALRTMIGLQQANEQKRPKQTTTKVKMKTEPARRTKSTQSKSTQSKISAC